MNKDFAKTKSMMFFVYDGNHKMTTWRSFIEINKANDVKFNAAHGSPHFLIFEICCKCFPKAMEAMQDVNK